MEERVYQRNNDLRFNVLFGLLFIKEGNVEIQEVWYSQQTEHSKNNSNTVLVNDINIQNIT